MSSINTYGGTEYPRVHPSLTSSPLVMQAVNRIVREKVYAITSQRPFFPQKLIDTLITYEGNVVDTGWVTFKDFSNIVSKALSERGIRVGRPCNAQEVSFDGYVFPIHLFGQYPPAPYPDPASAAPSAAPSAMPSPVWS